MYSIAVCVIYISIFFLHMTHQCGKLKQWFVSIVLLNKKNNETTYFGGREMNDGSMCSAAGVLYGPRPPAVCAATRAVYRPPGFRLLITTD